MCGSDAHELEVCPETPKGPIEVIVEKFGATKLQNENDLGYQSPPPATPPAEKWVTVAPKKHGRTLPLSKRKSPPKLLLLQLRPLSSLSLAAPPLFQLMTPDTKRLQQVCPYTPLVLAIQRYPLLFTYPSLSQLALVMLKLLLWAHCWGLQDCL